MLKAVDAFLGIDGHVIDSNLIEGNQTLPHQIREAQRGNYDSDPTARDHQLESVAHIKVQDWIRSASRDLSLIHISEPTRPRLIAYDVFCLEK